VSLFLYEVRVIHLKSLVKVQKFKSTKVVKSIVKHMGTIQDKHNCLYNNETKYKV